MAEESRQSVTIEVKLGSGQKEGFYDGDAGRGSRWQFTSGVGPARGLPEQGIRLEARPPDGW